MFSRRKPPVPGKIDTLIARSTVLQGDLAFAGGLHLDGRVVGRLSAAPDAAAATLWIGEAGCVEGGVEARHVVIEQQQIDTLRFDDLQGLQAIGGFQHLEALAHQHGAEEPPHLGVVVGKENRGAITVG